MDAIQLRDLSVTLKSARALAKTVAAGGFAYLMYRLIWWSLVFTFPPTVSRISGKYLQSHGTKTLLLRPDGTYEYVSALLEPDRISESGHWWLSGDGSGNWLVDFDSKHGLGVHELDYGIWPSLVGIETFRKADAL